MASQAPLELHDSVLDAAEAGLRELQGASEWGREQLRGLLWLDEASKRGLEFA